MRKFRMVLHFNSWAQFLLVSVYTTTVSILQLNLTPLRTYRHRHRRWFWDLAYLRRKGYCWGDSVECCCTVFGFDMIKERTTFWVKFLTTVIFFWQRA